MDKSTRSFRAEDAQRQWHLIDADGRTLGRIATQIAHLLRGKHKTSFTPSSDMGDFVVVVNVARIRLTGKRSELKEYFHYTGYPGGATYEKFKDLIRKHPERVMEHAVRGMLPHNRLGRQIIKKMKVYAGPDHPHAAQRPVAFTLQRSSKTA